MSVAIDVRRVLYSLILCGTRRTSTVVEWPVNLTVMVACQLKYFLYVSEQAAEILQNVLTPANKM